METIKVPVISNSEVKVVGNCTLIITLHETYLTIDNNSKQVEEDDTLGITKEVSYRYLLTTLKAFISGIHVAWAESYGVYQLIIIIPDKNNHVIEFDDFDEAMEVRDKILNWLIN